MLAIYTNINGLSILVTYLFLILKLGQPKKTIIKIVKDDIIEKMLSFLTKTNKHKNQILFLSKCPMGSKAIRLYPCGMSNQLGINKIPSD